MFSHYILGSVRILMSHPVLLEKCWVIHIHILHAFLIFLFSSLTKKKRKASVYLQHTSTSSSAVFNLAIVTPKSWDSVILRIYSVLIHLGAWRFLFMVTSTDDVAVRLGVPPSRAMIRIYRNDLQYPIYTQLIYELICMNLNLQNIHMHLCLFYRIIISINTCI